MVIAPLGLPNFTQYSSYLMVKASFVDPIRKCFESVCSELCQEPRVVTVFKVFRKYTFLQVLRCNDLESSPMRHPNDVIVMFVASTQHMMYFLSEGHLGDFDGLRVSLLRRHTREVVVTLKHASKQQFDR